MKKVFLIILLFCLCTACHHSTNTNQIKNDKQVQKKVEQKTVKKKETKKKYIICINPGHQAKANTNKEKQSPSSSIKKMKVTGGTSGIASHKSESQVVLDIGLKLRDELEKQGYTVVMTRTSQKVDLSNQQRAKIGNEAHADLTISLHLNGINNHNANGAFTICGKNSGDTQKIYKKSRKAAVSIINTYCNKTGIKNQGVSYRSDLTGLNWSTVPAIYIEMGHMTNRKEDLKLTNFSFQKKMVHGLVEGINHYFKEV